MKLKFFTLVSLLFSGAFLSAQMSGMMTMQQNSNSRGTVLGANTTTGAAGIALGNRAVMRGYVDFKFDYLDIEDDDQTESFSTKADVDFLFDFSPVTGEVHLEASDEIDLEQAFGRYAFNRDFNISFGRQLTVLGYETDEATGLHSVSHSYLIDKIFDSLIDGRGSNVPASFKDTKFRRNYVDGVRANFNNGRFGFSIGLHDSYWANDDFNGDNIAIDLAASLMIMPGLEARLGYAHQEIDKDSSSLLTRDEEISQFNAWIAYNPGDLTLAFEYDNFDISTADYWDILLLANYQFNEMFGATFKYSHENFEEGSFDSDADRLTFALLFTITQNLMFNVEYSHTSVDTSGNDFDVDEFYLQGLLTF